MIEETGFELQFQSSCIVMSNFLPTPNNELSMVNR